MSNRARNHPGVTLTPEMTASEWSVAWWRRRHDEGYFPGMEWHAGWKACPYPPPQFLELVRPTVLDRVLEIGCGYGEWMVPASPHVGRICGIDVHATLAEKARELFARSGVANAEFRLSDGLTIPYDARTFTAVYAISVFQHIPRATVRGYFDETNRVLTPFGRVLFHFRLADGNGPYSDDISVDHGGDFSTGWTADEAMAEAERVGWQATTIADDAANGGHSLFLYGVKVS